VVYSVNHLGSPEAFRVLGDFSPAPAGLFWCRYSGMPRHINQIVRNCPQARRGRARPTTHIPPRLVTQAGLFFKRRISGRRRPSCRPTSSYGVSPISRKASLHPRVVLGRHAGGVAAYNPAPTWHESPDNDTALVNTIDPTKGMFGYAITLNLAQVYSGNDPNIGLGGRRAVRPQLRADLLVRRSASRRRPAPCCRPNPGKRQIGFCSPM